MKQGYTEKEVDLTFILFQSEIYIVDDWEVKRENIKIMEELGKGSFGMVYRGIYSHPDHVSLTHE